MHGLGQNSSLGRPAIKENFGVREIQRVQMLYEMKFLEKEKWKILMRNLLTKYVYKNIQKKSGSICTKMLVMVLSGDGNMGFSLIFCLSLHLYFMQCTCSVSVLIKTYFKKGLFQFILCTWVVLIYFTNFFLDKDFIIFGILF